MANPTSPDDLDSIRGFGRRRGVSHTAVRKAIEDGRIDDALRRDAAGRVRIDWRVANALWEARTDPGQARSGPPPPPPPPDPQRRLFGPPPEPPPPPAAAPVRGLGDQYRSAAALRQTFQAQLARLDFEERTGKLVPAAEVRDEARAQARALRERLLELPDRLADELALEKDPRAVRAALLRELRTMLTELANAAAGEVTSGA